MQTKKLKDTTKAMCINTIERKEIYVRKNNPKKNGAHLVKKFTSNRYAVISIAKIE